MRIVFEPSGTQVQNDVLKARLDLYPDVGEKSYAQHYVSVPVFPPGGYPGAVNPDGSPKSQKAYDTWLAGLPIIWQLNPSLCLFVSVGQDISKTLLNQWIGDTLKADVLATIDEAMIQANAAHLISAYLRGKTVLSAAKTTTFDEAIKTLVNARLAGLSLGGQPGGIVQDIQPQSIDVGTVPANFNATATLYAAANIRTNVEVANPANATGNIDTVQAWWAIGGATAVRVGMFQNTSGNTLKCNAAVSIGAVTAGSSQTYAGLTMAVNTGEYIGCDNNNTTNCSIKANTSAGSGWWSYFGARLVSVNSTADFGAPTANYKLALYGTGTEPGTIYTRSATVMTGNKVASSRAITAGRSATVLTGNKVSSSRVWALDRTAMAKTGNKVTGIVQYTYIGITYTFSALVKTGNKVTASRAWTVVRSAIAKTGNLVTGIKAQLPRQKRLTVVISNETLTLEMPDSGSLTLVMSNPTLTLHV